MTQENKVRLLLGIFVGLLIGMNLIGGKIITVLGISVSVAIFMTPLTFLITDIIEEVMGKKTAQSFIYIGVAALLMTLVYTAVFVILDPAERYEFNDAYVTIFGVSIRMIIASIIAFVVSQTHDVWAFEFWKKKTHGKMLWLRNNASTMVSQVIDTLLFMMIAFYGISDKFTFGFIITLAIPYYLFKIAFAALDTPFVYLGARWLKGK
ncbi:hypothetical protein CO057_02065 [Candidatus Uhrbacteria bacterium CG_4_9_14_0_2_um_filter_41_50]|uniref:Probable queuosine precursor transporter n=1 Tax=Candidatus Uhrbacteria bacterium CG_4_9_14_0_2_um_filter_41_50 TaxID=1975031 RepID=A0A2M8EPA7_9BACT|nr:MAG: hypothetical protein COZ45_04110 [Candidatus Uhrbacteria bacterium CG_4_10_14_3_um_filter_41_21]PIZ54604.1 MAG: hypothetical protein COY24_03175 [Candidatus Uhrbacteria bacterium CG_4_10_14_0_2_um_filter_41_21]PJB84245.1 MAG: hypothetical protein CO086_04535 [Candidatus Uhrbacteria bacterium CG_4_9_14_0_8_um_filter_41_16]PJC24572.1 MAG: hypothetical protein CO057_02065 [Candidatus Uhrbacteria bacterium CG_4_9_14_0_2_um_filter_41_50]PJE74873.1 MAG: hypothetical protein COV03_03040 [Candi